MRTIFSLVMLLGIVWSHPSLGDCVVAGPTIPFTAFGDEAEVVVKVEPDALQIWLCDLWRYPGYGFGVQIAGFYPLTPNFLLSATGLQLIPAAVMVGDSQSGLCPGQTCRLRIRQTGDPVVPYYELWLRFAQTDYLLGEFDLLPWPKLHRMFL